MALVRNKRRIKGPTFSPHCSCFTFFNSSLFWAGGSSDSTQCEPCPPEFWPNAEQTACVARELDFLSFSETLGITLTTVAVSGATATAAVFVVFLHHRHTPIVSLFDFGL